MDAAPKDELEYDFSLYVKRYKGGRVERLPVDVPLAPPGIDPLTGVDSKDVKVDEATAGVTSMSVRLYLPKQAIGTDHPNKQHYKLPVLLFCHGGAFVIESAFSKSYHHYVNVLVSKARVVAVSVDHRLAPEHPLPVSYDDANSDHMTYVMCHSARESLNLLGIQMNLFGVRANTNPEEIQRAMCRMVGQNIFRERGMAYVEGLKMSSGCSGEVEVHETEDEDHGYFTSDPLGSKAAAEVQALAAFINRL